MIMRQSTGAHDQSKYSVLTALQTEKSMFHALFSSALDFFGKANCKGVVLLPSGLYMPVAEQPFRPKRMKLHLENHGKKMG
jgi:hypothetical protein